MNHQSLVWMSLPVTEFSQIKSSESPKANIYLCTTPVSSTRSRLTTNNCCVMNKTKPDSPTDETWLMFVKNLRAEYAARRRQMVQSRNQSLRYLCRAGQGNPFRWTKVTKALRT